MKLDPYLTACTKINSKWIIDLNIIHKIIQLMKENIEENLCGLWLGIEFFEMVPNTQFRKKI